MSLKNQQILIYMVIVTAAAIYLQLSNFGQAPPEEKSNNLCSMGPFKKAIIECMRNQRSENLCPMETLDWITSKGKLDVSKMIADVEPHIIDEHHGEKVKLIYQGCAEAANANGFSPADVANFFVACWSKMNAHELSKKAFCPEE